MTPREQAEAMVNSIRPWIQASVDPVAKSVRELQKRIDELPVPVNGTNGIDGKDGVNAEPVDMNAVSAIAQKSVDAAMQKRYAEKEAVNQRLSTKISALLGKPIEITQEGYPHVGISFIDAHGNVIR